MVLTVSAVRENVASQRERLPAMYGNIDFSLVPERLLKNQPELSDIGRTDSSVAPRLLADADLMGRMEAYTMLGDIVADAYAALMPTFGFRPLIDMLVLACERGVDAVPNAPPELHIFIRSMEERPEWLDMALIEEGARYERSGMAIASPWIVRGAFIGTFMNKYAALPMVLTGTLSEKTAARRIKETATFFCTCVLPGALDRNGQGFKEAAMVRLMHSMVRFNVLSRGKWDQAEFGVPIPQVDQMPGGLIGVYFLSLKVLAAGRSVFTRAERARVELGRYRCFLLGLPEDLLADTPQKIVDLWNARLLTIRRGFDDNTCGALLRATLAADLKSAPTAKQKLFERFERSFAKVHFMKNYCHGNPGSAETYGVHVTKADKRRAAIAGLAVIGRMKLYSFLLNVPSIGTLVDKRLVRRLERYLASLGHAEFTSNGAQYKPVPAAG